MEVEYTKHHCHQCRHRIKISEELEDCTTCNNFYTVNCLKRKYDEIVPEELKSSWICPRCRGICNCDKCRPKERGRGRGRGGRGGRGRGGDVEAAEGSRGGRGRGGRGRGGDVEAAEGSRGGRGRGGRGRGGRGRGGDVEAAEGSRGGRGRGGRGRGVEGNALEDMETTILSIKASLANEEEARKVNEKEMREVLQRVEAEVAAMRKKEEEEEEEEEISDVVEEVEQINVVEEEDTAFESKEDHVETEDTTIEEQNTRVYDLQARLREAENQVENIRNASLKESSELRQEILKRSEEINQLEAAVLRKKEELKKMEEMLAVLNGSLEDVTKKYHTVLTENRKLSNKVQDLLGKIRVFVRIKPFLKDHDQKQTTIHLFGDNGELAIKERHQIFKFNKVFGPESTQEEVFVDTKPLIRSVLDGTSVCIFAYGQTGSGKTYTMTGPDKSSPEDWGVNQRALNDLFHLSQMTRSSVQYEISAQMIQIYNDHVYDLLSSNSDPKPLVVSMSAPTNGLLVPKASTKTVTSTADVLELMNLGLTKRAVGATKLNDRSSRSHSVLNVHVCGTDLYTKAVWRGNLNLIDLAGSERVGKSEATGDRLREAGFINKSLSTLGDVMAALARKSEHVPYRNSKLTEVLQKSLEGRAKTMMFVHISPEVESFSETMSTLIFAEKVSGVKLGAARSTKEGIGVPEIKEQLKLMTEDGVQENLLPTEHQEKSKVRSMLPRPPLSLRNHVPSLTKGGPPKKSSNQSGVKGSPSWSTRHPIAELKTATRQHPHHGEAEHCCDN